MLGLTVSEGDFSINGESFTINSETTLKSLMNEINSSTKSGVGALLENGKLTLIANKTGAVLIDVKKGSSNFTNAIGITQGGKMLTDSIQAGTNGTSANLKGIIKTTNNYAEFSEGTFTLYTGKESALTHATINVQNGDTISDVIQKINVSGLDLIASLDSNGYFTLEQTNKGEAYIIKVEAGSSNFTEKIGLTDGVENIGISNSGLSSGYYTTVTGTNIVTPDTFVTAGSFKVNDKTINISEGTISSAITEINSSLTSSNIKASLEDGRIVFRSTLMGNIAITLEGGTSNFGSISGLTETSEKVAAAIVGQVGNKSTLTGSESVTAETMISDGTIKINGFLLDLSAGKLSDIIESINSQQADTKVTAAIINGKFTLTSTENGENAISVEAGLSNLVQITGIAGYQTITGSEEKFGSSKSSMTMSNNLTYETQVLESILTINGKDIKVAGTIASVISTINANTGATNVEAFLNSDNKFVLRNVMDGANGLSFSTSSDFGRVAGAGTYIITGGSNTTL